MRATRHAAAPCPLRADSWQRACAGQREVDGTRKTSAAPHFERYVLGRGVGQFSVDGMCLFSSISLDFLDGWIQSNLTISTLMVGVSLTLMGLVGFSDVDLMSAHDSDSTVKAITWNYLTTLCSWVGFLTSGAVFGWSLVLSGHRGSNTLLFGDTPHSSGGRTGDEIQVLH